VSFADGGEIKFMLGIVGFYKIMGDLMRESEEPVE